MRSFYWVVRDVLAGCGRPGARGHAGRGAPATDADVAVALERDLLWLREQGIAAVLSLTETPLPEEATLRHGLTVLHLPIPDLTAPTPEQFDRALRFLDEQRLWCRPVAVHCLVGQGRTGTILAATLIRDGATPEGALARIRALCPGAVENPAQERALHAFAARRDWIV